MDAINSMTLSRPMLEHMLAPPARFADGGRVTGGPVASAPFGGAPGKKWSGLNATFNFYGDDPISTKEKVIRNVVPVLNDLARKAR
jgi:hypothetical protein